MYNKVILVGIVETVVKQLPEDENKGVFILKTKKTWKHKSRGKSQTENQWHKIVVGGPLLRTSRRIIIKNKIILIEGELRASEKNIDENSDNICGYSHSDEVAATFIKKLNT